MEKLPMIDKTRINVDGTLRAGEYGSDSIVISGLVCDPDPAVKYYLYVLSPDKYPFQIIIPKPETRGAKIKSPIERGYIDEPGFLQTMIIEQKGCESRAKSETFKHYVQGSLNCGKPAVPPYNSALSMYEETLCAAKRANESADRAESAANNAANVKPLPENVIIDEFGLTVGDIKRSALCQRLIIDPLSPEGNRDTMFRVLLKNNSRILSKKVLYMKGGRNFRVRPEGTELLRLFNDWGYFFTDPYDGSEMNFRDHLGFPSMDFFDEYDGWYINRYTSENLGLQIGEWEVFPDWWRFWDIPEGKPFNGGPPATPEAMANQMGFRAHLSSLGIPDMRLPADDNDKCTIAFADNGIWRADSFNAVRHNLWDMYGSAMFIKDGYLYLVGGSMRQYWDAVSPGDNDDAHFKNMLAYLTTTPSWWGSDFNFSDAALNMGFFYKKENPTEIINMGEVVVPISRKGYRGVMFSGSWSTGAVIDCGSAFDEVTTGIVQRTGGTYYPYSTNTTYIGI